jgi:hypothetical protein
LEKIRNEKEINHMRYLFLNLLVVLALNGFAQQSDNNLKQNKQRLAALIIDTSYKHIGTIFYVNFPTLIYSSPPQLNSILSKQQAKTLGRFTLMGGLGFEERWKWFACGLDFSMGENIAENDRYEVKSSITLAGIYFKYYVWRRTDIGGFYPILGITARNQSVYITDKSNTNDINGLFNQSGSVNVNLSTGYLNTGIGFDLLNFKKEDAFYGSMKMGFLTNIGSSADNQWYVNENRVLVGAPVERLNTFYAQFVIGYSFNQFSRKQNRIF